MNQFTAHEMENNERLTRLETKIDFIVEGCAKQKQMMEKIEDVDKRLIYLEQEKKIYKRIVAPLTHVVIGAIGAWIGKFFYHS